MAITQINRIENNGNTALHVASYMGYEEIVRLLLIHGASRSIRNKTSNLRVYDENVRINLRLITYLKIFLFK